MELEEPEKKEVGVQTDLIGPGIDLMHLKLANYEKSLMVKANSLQSLVNEMYSELWKNNGMISLGDLNDIYKF